MFCPNCGKADQKENSYCRSCGEFLPDLTILESFPLAGNSPQQKLKIVSIFNLITFLLSLLCVFWMYVTNFNVPILLHIGIIFMIFTALSQLCNFIFIRHLANLLPTFGSKRKNLQKSKSGELLTEADFSDTIPASVIENTTNKLKKHSDNLTA